MSPVEETSDEKPVGVRSVGLAAVVLVFGQSSAKAGHCASGYGVGYGGYGYGGYYGGGLVTPVVPVVPSYGYGYQNYGVRHGGYGHHHHYPAPYRQRSYLPGYGNDLHVLTPGLHLDLNY